MSNMTIDYSKINNYHQQINELLRKDKDSEKKDLYDLKEKLIGFIEEMPISKFYNEAKDNKIQQLGRLHFVNSEIYQNRQFRDTEFGLDRTSYNKWIKDTKKSFIHTIPANQLLMGSKTTYDLSFHYSEEELNSFTTIGYSPKQILETLKLLDKKTIMLLLSNNVRLVDYSFSEFADEKRYIIGEHFDENGKPYLIGSPIYGTKSVFYREFGQSNYNVMNAHEFLFRALRLPISTVLNSINQALDSETLNDESINELNVSDELCEKIYTVRESNMYKRLERKL